MYDQEIERFNAELATCGLEAQHSEAAKRLKAAEDVLIKNGLLFAPYDIREDLERGAKYNYTVRQKLLDIILRFDFTGIMDVC